MGSWNSASKTKYMYSTVKPYGKFKFSDLKQSKLATCI